VGAARAFGLASLGDAGWILNPEGCAARALLQAGPARRQPPAARGPSRPTPTSSSSPSVARERGLGLVPARILARSPLRLAFCGVAPASPGSTFPLTIWAVRGRVAPELAPVFDALDRALIERLGGTRVSLRSPSSSRGVVPSRTSRRTAPSSHLPAAFTLR